MKKLLFLCAACCLAVTLFAQSAPPAKILITPVQCDWAADGSGLYLTVIRADMERRGIPQSRIFFVNNEGVIKSVIKGGSSVSVSPDGKQLAFVRAGTDPGGASNELYVFDLESQTEKLLLADGIRKSELNFSPDGKRIAYTVVTRDPANPKNARGNIFIYDIATKKTEQLTQNQNGQLSFSPQWDATGKKILYYKELGDNHDQIYLTDAHGKKHTNLTADTTTHNFYPVWYGKKIMYMQFPNNVMVMDADGKNRAALEGLQTPFSVNVNPALSKLAYLSRSSRESPAAVLYVLDFNTKESRLLLDRPMLEALQF